MPVSVLVINPNLSVLMTDNLRDLLGPMALEYKVDLTFFTAPAEAPKEIDGEETLRELCRVCLPAVVPLLGDYDLFLVACYLDHPLIYELQKRTLRPVLGIFQALLYAGLESLQGGEQMVILTSNHEWEPILDRAVEHVFATDERLRGRRSLILPTKALNLNVLSLSDPKVYAEIKGIACKLVDATGAKCVLMGCAGLLGVDLKLGAEPELKDVVFVDSVRAGVKLLGQGFGKREALANVDPGFFQRFLLLFRVSC